MGIIDMRKHLAMLWQNVGDPKRGWWHLWLASVPHGAHRLFKVRTLSGCSLNASV